MNSAATLEERTLVLNRSWAVVNITSVRRALGMVYRRVARVVAPDTYETHDFASWTEVSTSSADGARIHTVTLSIRVPEAIVLLAYDAMPETRLPFSRKNLFRRDHFTCQYCSRRRPPQELTIDHVVPRSLNGRSTWTNCVLACLDCNVRKGNRTPEEAGMELARRPQRPRWAPYITVGLGRRRASWDRFVSDRYWNVELEP